MDLLTIYSSKHDHKNGSLVTWEVDIARIHAHFVRVNKLTGVKIDMSHFAYACKMRYPLNLVLENIEYLWFYWTFCIVIFRLWFKTPQPFNSYPCHASEVTRNTLNHCLKFTVRSIFCHICYGKISEKNVNTFFKVKLFVSKTSDSCFQGFDLFQMLLASHS